MGKKLSDISWNHLLYTRRGEVYYAWGREESVFGTWLKERRLQLGLSQAQTSEAIGVSQQAFSRWENNQRIPSDLVVLDRLAVLLDVSLHDLAERLAESDDAAVEPDQTSDGIEARLARIEEALRRLGGKL